MQQYYWNWRYLYPEQITVKFEPRDLWIGVFWKLHRSIESKFKRLELYICIVPMFPIYITFAWNWDYRHVQ